MAAVADTPFVVEALSIVKRFGGVQALAGVDFRVRRGEIHALLGQNGAGKSTLVKILNGVHRAGSFDGTILLDGRPVSFASTAQARAGGVGYVPQEIEVLEQLTVAENVFAGQTGLGGRLVRQRVLERQAAGLFRDLGLDISPTTLVAALTPAQRHIVMIARALAARPAVLMLDEPTASLSGAEVDRLFALLRRLKAQGTTMIFITHRLPEVMALCDRATVLRDGRVAAELKRGEFDANTVIGAMSGQRLSRLYPHHEPPAAAAPVLLKVENLTVAPRGHERHGVHGVGFELRAGEILGIAGLLGSGRSELLGALYGAVHHGGRIWVDGRPVTMRSPRDARAASIALLTEDRKRSGLLFNLPVARNITIGNLGLFSAGGMVRAGAERAAALRVMRDLRVKAPSPAAAVAHLSGGNQQKLLLGRVLMRTPRILLLDEPTKGVDVGTRSEIYRLIVDLAETGVGLVVVSSELEEVIGLADRCLVIADGRFIDEFPRGAGGEERVLTAIAAAQAGRAA